MTTVSHGSRSYNSPETSIMFSQMSQHTHAAKMFFPFYVLWVCYCIWHSNGTLKGAADMPSSRVGKSDPEQQKEQTLAQAADFLGSYSWCF